MGLDPPREFDLYLHLFPGEVADSGDLDLVGARRVLDGSDQHLGGDAEGELPDDDPLGIPGVQFGPYQDLPHPVLVVGNVGQTARREIGVENELVPAEARLHGVQDLVEVVREDLRGHPDGYALGPLNEHYGDLGRERHRLLLPSVVRILVLGEVGIVENLLRKREDSAFDVPGRRSLVAGQEVPEVTLLLDEEVLVGEDHQGRIDGLVSMRMVLHAVTDHVGDLVEFTVVHLEKGVHEPPLHRLEAVVYVRNGPVLDHVRGVFEEIRVEEGLYVGHYIRFSMM